MNILKNYKWGIFKNIFKDYKNHQSEMLRNIFEDFKDFNLGFLKMCSRTTCGGF